MKAPMFPEMVTAEQLTVKGHLFGLIKKRHSYTWPPGDQQGPKERRTQTLVGLYIEDDEHYYLKLVVSKHWLQDLKEVLSKI